MFITTTTVSFHRGLTQPVRVFRAYEYLEVAAEMGHTEALAKIAESCLFGIHQPQNITKAKEILDTLATKGSPHGQRVSSGAGGRA